MSLELIHAAILGLVEGLTEFIPVSSTGHLIVVQDWLGFDRLVGKHVADTFDVFIQTGAILAVIIVYWQRIRDTLVQLPTQRQAQRFALNVAIAFLLSALAAVAAAIGRVAGRWLDTAGAGGVAGCACDCRCHRSPCQSRTPGRHV